MDGDGRQQDLGSTVKTDDAEAAGSGGPYREEGKGEDRRGGGALATDRGDKAVENQSTVSTDDYSGSSESGV